MSVPGACTSSFLLPNDDSDSEILEGFKSRTGFHTTPPANNGMHPTADTLLVIYFQTLGAAGDAER